MTELIRLESCGRPEVCPAVVAAEMRMVATKSAVSAGSDSAGSETCTRITRVSRVDVPGQNFERFADLLLGPAGGN